MIPLNSDQVKGFIKLFVLPLRSPKPSALRASARRLGRAHRTHTEEFYEIIESPFNLTELRADLLEWERIYNTVRPHQALGYMTPLQFLEQWRQKQREEDRCH
jgi:transposase InsO family protein